MPLRIGEKPFVSTKTESEPPKIVSMTWDINTHVPILIARDLYEKIALEVLGEPRLIKFPEAKAKSRKTSDHLKASSKIFEALLNDIFVANLDRLKKEGLLIKLES